MLLLAAWLMASWDETLVAEIAIISQRIGEVLLRAVDVRRVGHRCVRLNRDQFGLHLLELFIFVDARCPPLLVVLLDSGMASAPLVDGLCSIDIALAKVVYLVLGGREVALGGAEV